jgi:S1-C subfamily serine protease
VALVVTALAAFLTAGFAARGLVDDRSPATTSAQIPATPSTAPRVTTPLVAASDDEPVAAVASALGPSVVVIKNADGLGSGVVYDPTGLILTNAHVVGTSKAVTVTLGDGQSLDGTVLGRDTTTDIAVIKVDAGKELPAARLANAAATVGQLAVAVGSPFGLDHTVTAGVVSAVNRPVDNESGVVASMIQTDAPINPGNSGGALANRHGEVIGINTMIFSQSGENNGIGFAIPIDTAMNVADKITGGDSLARAFLGTSTTQPTDGTAGARIAKVEPGSPAEQAGLQVGDVVTSIDGTAVKQSGDLAAAVGTKSPGDHVSVTVQRGDAEVTIDVTLAARSTGAGTK